jgi:hypothetical protein
MNETQKEACRLMDKENLGAIVTKYGWTWKETCRNNPDAAREVVLILGSK